MKKGWGGRWSKGRPEVAVYDRILVNEEASARAAKYELGSRPNAPTFPSFALSNLFHKCCHYAAAILLELCIIQIFISSS